MRGRRDREREGVREEGRVGNEGRQIDKWVNRHRLCRARKGERGKEGRALG